MAQDKLATIGRCTYCSLPDISGILYIYTCIYILITTEPFTAISHVRTIYVERSASKQIPSVQNNVNIITSKQCKSAYIQVLSYVTRFPTINKINIISLDSSDQTSS